MNPISLSPASAALPATAQDANGVDQLANKEIFMQLLVAQLKNQNPLSPADGTQFVTQLAQFSELEQTTSMGQDIASILKIIQNLKASEPSPSTSPTNP